MAVESCTSCSSASNLAAQYAEQLAEGTRNRRAAEGLDKPGVSSTTVVTGNPAQNNRPTVNGLGETVGVLINTTA